MWNLVCEKGRTWGAATSKELYFDNVTALKGILAPEPVITFATRIFVQGLGRGFFVVPLKVCGLPALVPNGPQSQPRPVPVDSWPLPTCTRTPYHAAGQQIRAHVVSGDTRRTQ